MNPPEVTNQCSDPDTIIAEYQSEGQVLATGARYANSYIGIWKFRNGKMAMRREYADPSRTT